MAVDAMVVSMATLRAAALEAARLHHDGISGRIVIARWRPEPLDEEMRRLAVPWLPPHELAAAMLEKSGVPAAAVELLDDSVDGLNTEIAAVAAWARRERPASLLYLTSRSHSRRASWLLRRLLPDGTRLLVHAPALDGFRPDAWWRSRTESREVAMEYLRWMNTFGLRDFWRRQPPDVPEP
ncbi:MAG: YdcF family protein [Deltaproteobacteria bacterium]|nr:YdcF family protein [Deltaproteobacteria bacterium]